MLNRAKVLKLTNHERLLRTTALATSVLVSKIQSSENRVFQIKLYNYAAIDKPVKLCSTNLLFRVSQKALEKKTLFGLLRARHSVRIFCGKHLRLFSITSNYITFVSSPHNVSSTSFCFLIWNMRISVMTTDVLFTHNRHYMNINRWNQK